MTLTCALVFVGLCGAKVSGASIYDVTQFGATGDGSTDDGQAIQAAADAASRNGGGIVFFPPGRYLHTALIDFHTNTTVQGSGAVSVLIASTPAASAIRFADAGNCSIRELKISSQASTRLQNDEASALLFSHSH